MSENKTHATALSVDDFLSKVAPDAKQADARRLLALFAAATGWQAKMWGPSIIGFGSYRYRYDSGREGEMCASGFSPRKHEFSLYLSLGELGDVPGLARLGKHKTGKGCLYIKRLADVDEAVLRGLIVQGIESLKKKWSVSAS